MTLVHAVLERDGLALREVRKGDGELLDGWRRLPGNAGMFNWWREPSAIQGYLEGLGRSLWYEPMIAVRDGRPVGALLNPVVEANSLNTLLVVLLEDPDRDRLAVPLYIRHLFWSAPLHRVYVEVPALADRYRSLLEWAGFREEGVLQDHLCLAGSFHSVGIYGLLRSDFDRWSERELPPLSLPSPSSVP